VNAEREVRAVWRSAELSAEMETATLEDQLSPADDRARMDRRLKAEGWLRRTARERRRTEPRDGFSRREALERHTRLDYRSRGEALSRMEWTGRAPAPNGSQSTRGACQEKEHRHASHVHRSRSDHHRN
jgi:hypothetical protein